MHKPACSGGTWWFHSHDVGILENLTDAFHSVSQIEEATFQSKKWQEFYSLGLQSW